MILGSVRPDRHEPQPVPVRGTVTVVAETSGLMDNRLSSVFVPASPSERAVSTGLCLPRSGAPAPAGYRRDDDNDSTHAPKEANERSEDMVSEEVAAKEMIERKSSGDPGVPGLSGSPKPIKQGYAGKTIARRQFL